MSAQHPHRSTIAVGYSTSSNRGRRPRERPDHVRRGSAGHDRRYAIDPSKIERELGWCRNGAFETGLVKTVRWYVDLRAWWQAILDRGYKADASD